MAGRKSRAKTGPLSARDRLRIERSPELELRDRAAVVGVLDVEVALAVEDDPGGEAVLVAGVADRADAGDVRAVGLEHEDCRLAGPRERTLRDVETAVR